MKRHAHLSGDSAGVTDVKQMAASRVRMRKAVPLKKAHDIFRSPVENPSTHDLCRNRNPIAQSRKKDFPKLVETSGPSIAHR